MSLISPGHFQVLPNQQVLTNSNRCLLSHLRIIKNCSLIQEGWATQAKRVSDFCHRPSTPTLKFLLLLVFPVQEKESRDIPEIKEQGIQRQKRKSVWLPTTQQAKIKTSLPNGCLMLETLQWEIMFFGWQPFFPGIKYAVLEHNISQKSVWIHL